MAIKFDFNKLRTAVTKWTTGVDTALGTLAAGDQAIYTPHLRHARPTEHITNASAVTRTLLDAESGTLFSIDLSAVDNDIAITLPTAAGSAGVYYDFCFMVDSDDDADFTLTTGAAGTDIYGGITTLAANSTVDAFAGISNIVVDGSVAQSAEGLRLSVICDGTNWHLSGHIMTAVGTVHLVGGAGA
jgi:hypothetical protein